MKTQTALSSGGAVMTAKDKNAERLLDDWINGFVELTDKLPSPNLFRRWSAISLIAGALERRVWVHTFQSNLYPNLYIVLLSPPGIGKTMLTSKIWSLWRMLGEEQVAPTSVTKASLIDRLRKAERKIIRPNDVPSIVSYHTIKVASNELNVFLPSYDNEFMAVLTDLYDGHPYEESRRTKDLNFLLPCPQFNLIACTTPSALVKLLPEGAWDQGFLSRTLLVYDPNIQLKSLFDEDDIDPHLQNKVEQDLKTIGELYGRMTFTKEAAVAIDEWHMKKGPPRPTHPRLQHYCTRRTAHLLKLCMVASASESNSLKITIEHFQRALGWMLELETAMEDIFKAMTLGGDVQLMNDVWYHAWTEYLKTNAPIPEPKIIEMITSVAGAKGVSQMLDLMKRSEMLKEGHENKVGKVYTPKRRKD